MRVTLSAILFPVHLKRPWLSQSPLALLATSLSDVDGSETGCPVVDLPVRKFRLVLK